MHSKQIRLVYGILLSVALAVAAVCLMAACLHIYFSGGEQIFTPEKVAKTFHYIMIPVYLAAAMTVVGIILHLCLPLDPQRPRLGKNEPLILRKLHEKQDYTRCQDVRIRATIAREQKLRKRLSRINLALLILGSCAFLAYALEFDRYNLEDITGVVIRGVWALLPCMALPFAFGIFRTIETRNSIRREIQLMKLVAAPRESVAAPQKSNQDALLGIRIALLVVALVCIVGGFWFEGWSDVLTKAINICTECVGLG